MNSLDKIQSQNHIYSDGIILIDNNDRHIQNLQFANVDCPDDVFRGSYCPGAETKC